MRHQCAALIAPSCRRGARGSQMGSTSVVSATPEPHQSTSEWPEDEFRRWRHYWTREWDLALMGLGKLPLVMLIFVPRACLSYSVILLAQLCRAIARLVDSTSSYEKKSNLRILIVTDYMPPQTHGIAVRFSQYIHHMRAQGHEVQVFTTSLAKNSESSFDHPCLPSIVSPFNVHNRMAYNPGMKLAWYIGSKQWDLVHVVFPTNIGLALLPACWWRAIPVYCSHHVDMEYYVGQYVKLKRMAEMGHLLYWFMVKLAAIKMATINAAPTLCFLDSHIPKCVGARARIPSGVKAGLVPATGKQAEEERREILRLVRADPNSDCCVLLIVSRLAPEKDAVHALEAMRLLQRAAAEGAAEGGCGFASLDGKRPCKLLIAGDGPSRGVLESYANTHALPVVFLGNVPNDRTPALYRAADVFVTCSTSETYGLTCLEALSCGTPSVMPRCAVFDELWSDRIPKEWRYMHASAVSEPGATDERRHAALLAALRMAGSAVAKRKLAEEPIKASWADATQELLRQYELAIAANLPYRKELYTYIRLLNHMVRGTLMALVLWWLMRVELRFVTRMLVKYLGD